MKSTGTILVVDDNLGTLKMMVEILQAEGYQARPANSGDLALRAMVSQLPDLVLLDIQMPGIDGFEVCRRLKADERTCRIPVIFLSAEADQKERIKVFGLGAVDFIAKPFQREELLARISTHLELWRLRQHLEAEIAQRTKELEQRNDELLRVSERLFLATRAARIGVWDWNVVKNELVWDNSMFELYGLRREDFAGAYEAWTRTIHPQDRARTEEAIQAALRGDREYAAVFRVIWPDGSVHHIKADGQTFRGQDGKPLRMVGTNLDITERVLAEEALARLNQQYESILTSAGEGILGLDVDGNQTFINPAAAEMLGYKPNELLGRPAHDTWHHSKPDGSPLSPDGCGIFAAYKDGRVHRSSSDIFWRKDGSSIQVEHVTTPTYENGRLVGAVLIFTDITERRNFEQHLAQAQKMEAIGTLAGGIAHDFNNILSAISGYTELALMKCTEPSQLEDLKQVRVASARATELVKQILAFSRASKEEVLPLKPKFVINEALKLLRASIPTTIEIRHTISSDSVVLADAGEIHRIVVNLCTNATLAMEDKGGVLVVELDDVELDAAFASDHPDAKPGKYVRLTVRDTGCGMTDAVKSRIFDPFFTTRAEGKGTGMGLSVVHGIVKSRGGTVSVASVLNEGTTFQVFLPVQEGANTSSNLKMDLPATGTERILFVDDEPAVAQIAQRSLTPLGYKVTAFTSSVQALACFQASPGDFDVLVTDMTMPHMTGDQLSLAVKAIRPDLPVVLCTGYSSKITAEKAKEVGIDEFLLKPATVGELSEVIRNVLKAKRGQSVG